MVTFTPKSYSGQNMVLKVGHSEVGGLRVLYPILTPNWILAILNVLIRQ